MSRWYYAPVDPPISDPDQFSLPLRPIPAFSTGVQMHLGNGVRLGMATGYPYIGAAVTFFYADPWGLLPVGQIYWEGESGVQPIPIDAAYVAVYAEVDGTAPPTANMTFSGQE